MHSGINKELNIRKAESLIDEAAAKGAEVVGLPEMFNFFGPDEDKARMAEPLDGPTISRLKDKAKEHGIYIHGGSILEKIPGSHKVYNTTVFINPRGEIIAVYRKIHLFDISITEDGVEYRESTFVEPGNKLVTVEVEGWTFGFTICYDLRFPELYRKLTLMGAEAIWVPAAFALATGKDHWIALCRARAIENQVYILAPAQIGRSPETGYVNYGRSVIIDPWGIIMSQAVDEEGVIIAEIDKKTIERIRKGLPVLKHRRPDVYG